MLVCSALPFVIIVPVPAPKKRMWKWWPDVYNWIWNAQPFVMLPLNWWAWVVKKQKTFAVFVLTYAKNAGLNVLNTKLSTAKNVPKPVSGVQMNAGKWQHNSYKKQAKRLLFSLITNRISWNKKRVCPIWKAWVIKSLWSWCWSPFWLCTSWCF